MVGDIIAILNWKRRSLCPFHRLFNKYLLSKLYSGPSRKAVIYWEININTENIAFFSL